MESYLCYPICMHGVDRDSSSLLLLSLTRTGSLFVCRHERVRGILFLGRLQEASPYRWTEVIEIAYVSWLNGIQCLAFPPLSPEDEYRSSFLTVTWKRCKMAGNVWSTSRAWRFHVWRSVACSCRGLTLCRLSRVPLGDMPGRDFLACHILSYVTAPGSRRHMPYTSHQPICI
jgi:hypothetical protein